MSDVQNKFLVGQTKGGIKILLLNNRTLSKEEAINLCSHIISNLNIKSTELRLGIHEISADSLSKFSECSEDCLHVFGIDDSGVYHPPCPAAYEQYIERQFHPEDKVNLTEKGWEKIK